MKAPLITLLSCIALFSSSASSAAKQSEAQDLAQHVNPFIGTSNFGATHPGAQYPHGIASITPFNVAFKAGEKNKFEKDASWHSRPYVSDNQFLTGFSNVNLSGVGCPDFGSLLLMPTQGELAYDPEHNGSSYSAEQASPGYYTSTLDKYKLKVELASTQRTTLSRYHFNAGQANILLNLGLGLTNETGAMVKRVSDTEVEGFKTIGTFCYNPEDVRPIYFVAKVSKAPSASGVFKKMPQFKNVEADWVKYNNTYKPYADYPYEMAGENLGAYFSYQLAQDEVIEVKLGVSFVSIENARENLYTEQPEFDFQQTVKDSRAAWNKLFNRVKVTGSAHNKTLFYSALYHMLIHPSIIQDVNGDYPKMEHTGIGNTKGKNRYSVFSLWDTHRNLHPFLSLVYPEIQSEMVNSMVDMAKESGWLPKWELASMETNVMVGDPATPVIADTYLRGIRDFDVNAAYQFAKKASDQLQDNPVRPDIQAYNELGYVPVDNEGTWEGSVSTSQEYYIADWNLAQLAQALGHSQDAQRYLAKSAGYKKLFDPTTGMLRPKHANGKWFTPYDPELGRNFEPAPGYVEGNAWNYRFYVPHDMPGLIALLGGEQAFYQQLNATFDTDNFDMANEPDITYPYLYNFVEGKSADSSQRVKGLIKHHYLNTPAGIPGNDDAGTLSSWLVFSMMGIYPVTPGDMNYAVVDPSFEKIEISLHPKYYSGDKLVIKSANHKSLNGKPLNQPFVNHHQLVQGGILNL